MPKFLTRIRGPVRSLAWPAAALGLLFLAGESGDRALVLAAGVTALIPVASTLLRSAR